MYARTNTQVHVVLPVYNEAGSLESLLSRFERLAEEGVHLARILVVDDGSVDRSAAIAQAFRNRLPVEILTHSTNQGLGRTIQDGLAYIASLAAPSDVVVSMDADDTHPPELIGSMLEALENGLDIVIASRYQRSARVEGLSRVRIATSYGARAVFQVLTPIPNVRDYTCGFRAYRAEALQMALVRNGGRLSRERGFACMAEILLAVAAGGARCGEVPLVLNYRRKGGPSKMNVPGTALHIVQLAMRWRLQARAPKPKDQPTQPRRSA
ncbi:MAG TPA: glycosyltransferase family 2 protein [Bryobacteraceae bacterium]|nr:glycosyltransferase family 2 protein [Bryobacteraceae bacterium]